MKSEAALVFGALLFTAFEEAEPKLADYCFYYAHSREELRDCLRHIDYGESNPESDDNAAR